MSSINNGVSQNNIDDVSILADELYENIFKVNLVRGDVKSWYFYNILNKVILPDELSDEVYDEVTLDRKMSWTYLSFKLYGSISLWWLLVLLNKPDYIFMAKSGQSYKYIKVEYISNIITDIKNQLQ